MQRILLTATLLAAAPALAHAATLGPNRPPAGPAAPAAPAAFRCGPGDQAQALNAMLARGGAVRLDRGTCLLGGPLRPGSGSTLTGAGRGVTVLKAAGGAFNVIDIGAGPGAGPEAPPVSRVEIADLSIDGSATAGSAEPRAASGVMIWPAVNGVRLRGLEITANGNAGVYVMGHDVAIAGSDIHDNWHNGIYVSGVFGSLAGPAEIDGNTVRHNSLARTPGWAHTHPGEHAWDGIDCGPNHTRCIITRNLVDRNDILVRDAGTRRSTGWSGPDRIVGNTVTDANQACIDVAARINGFEVVGNHVSNCAPNAIGINGAASNGTVTDNVVNGAQVAGIALRGTGSNVTVARNVVTGAGRMAYFVRGTARVVMQDNRGDPVVVNKAGPGLEMR